LIKVRSAGKDVAEKTENTNSGTEIIVFGSIRETRSKIVLKISVERPVFKGFNFFSFLILLPGEDYNLFFRSEFCVPRLAALSTHHDARIN
jgi:hypothetical protein